MEEKWEQCPAPYESYMVSDKGNYRRIGGKNENYHFSTNSQGYKLAHMWNTNTKKFHLVRIHNLMCQTFKPEFRELLQSHELVINHLDENPSNNNLDNLQVCTRTDNMKYGKGYYKMIESFVTHQKKSIDQYDMEGNFIKHYDSVRATEKDGYESSGIVRCAKGEYKQYKGYVWKYSELS